MVTMIRKLLLIKLLIAIGITSILPNLAMAKDITNEQRQAYQARERYQDNKSNHEKLLQRISRQESRITKEQEKLDQMKKDEVAAITELEQSKADLDAKTQTLNDVWDSRHQ